MRIRDLGDLLGVGGPLTMAALLAVAGLLASPLVGGAAHPAEVHAPGSGAAAACDTEVPEAVRQAVAAVQAGNLDRADELLTDTLRRCPRHPELLAELGGLRFRQGRMAEAEVLAGRLVEVDPESRYGWELLGTLRYLDDDRMGALRAWSRSGSPVVRSVDVPVRGPDGPQEEEQAMRAVRAVGIEPGDSLDPEELVRGTRRLASLPAASRARLGYTMLPEGEARVEGALVLIPRLPVSRLELAEHAVRAATGSVDVAFGDLAGRFERWEVSGRREGTIRRGTLGLAHPAPLGEGVWRWTAEHRSGRYEDQPIERNRIEWGHAHWLTARFWGTARGGFERRRSRGNHLGGGLGAMLLPLDGWGSLELNVDGWVRVARSGGREPPPVESERFGRLDVEAFLHPAGLEGAGPLPRLQARLGLIALSPNAPQDLAPRMGRSGAVRVPMRAVSDLDGDGVVRSPFPGRSWVHGGVEVGRRVASVGPVEVGVAAFGDGVRVLQGTAGDPDDAARRGALHLGAGLRARLLGVDGRLRLDWAIDPSDGSSGVSGAWLPGRFPPR